MVNSNLKDMIIAAMIIAVIGLAINIQEYRRERKRKKGYQLYKITRRKP